MYPILTIILSLIPPEVPETTAQTASNLLANWYDAATQLEEEDRAFIIAVNTNRDVLIAQQRTIDQALNTANDHLHQGDYLGFTRVMNQVLIVIERLEETGTTLTRQHKRYDALLRLASRSPRM
jgi:hypothetical protein